MELNSPNGGRYSDREIQRMYQLMLRALCEQQKVSQITSYFNPNSVVFKRSVGRHLEV